MEHRQFGRTGIRVTELCLGAMTFGREAPESDSRTMFDRYLDAGGDFVDTADAYGLGASEEILGRVFTERPGLRDSIVLATKFRMPASRRSNDVGASRRHIRESIERSLRRLQTEWVDLYQIHAWDSRTPLEETLSTLDDLVHEGKVRYVGASNYTGWQLAKALGVSALHDWEPFVSLQPQYSLIAPRPRARAAAVVYPRRSGRPPVQPAGRRRAHRQVPRRRGAAGRDAGGRCRTRVVHGAPPARRRAQRDGRRGGGRDRGRPRQDARRRSRSTGSSPGPASLRRSSARAPSSSSTTTSAPRAGRSKTSTRRPSRRPATSSWATPTTSSAGSRPADPDPSRRRYGL